MRTMIRILYCYSAKPSFWRKFFAPILPENSAKSVSVISNLIGNLIKTIGCDVNRFRLKAGMTFSRKLGEIIFGCGFLALLSIFSLVHAGYAAGLNETEEMILIPAGEFLMGSSGDEVKVLKDTFGKRELYSDYPFEAEMPKRKVFVKSFYIDRHEVTNKKYMQFIKQTGHTHPRHWQGGMYNSGKGDYPVLYVSQEDAAAYAKWEGKRLPTEEEWEKAARGTNGRIYPWGDNFDPYKAVTADSDLRLILGALCVTNSANKVELAQGDLSPYGVRDMAGNVREWTSTAAPGTPSMVIVKGASWVDLSINARAAHREYIPKKSLSHIIGFRCVKDTELKLTALRAH